MAMIAIITGFFGGVAALLGMFARIAALGLAITIGDAITHAHFQNGFFLQMSCEGNCLHGIEYNLSLLALSLSLVFLGGGISLWISLFRICSQITVSQLQIPR